MWLGIDVGGTFTDAVVVAEGQVLAQVKTPTTHGRLLDGILNAMDKALTGLKSKNIERIALSTTIVTNALVEGRTERVGLCLMSGPGMDISGLVPETPCFLSGYIDHRGREISPPCIEEIEEACRYFNDCEVFAIAGKFAVRNPQHELTAARVLQQHAKSQHITLGSSMSGTLNFLRRANSAYYNAAVWRLFGNFSLAVEEALRQRGINAPVYVLKADGGTIPLSLAKEQPVEAIFTGPAASVLGIMAMKETSMPAVSLDIGGTTTDIALWQNGVPMFAERGAKVSGYVTAVRAFWLKSVGIGGDSYVRREAGQLKVGPERRGPAMALGGPEPTVSDAMVVAGICSFGNKELAAKAMEQISAPGQSLHETVEMVLTAAAEEIYQAIEDMLDEQAAEPVYRVEDIVHSERFKPQLVIGVGGAAKGLAPLVAKRMNIACVVPPGGMVANAVGAAVARPTLDITLRVDTAQGYYTVAELGLREKLPSRRFYLADARAVATKHLAERAEQAGIAVSAMEQVYEEEFNLVRGFNTVGKIITCKLQIKPGVLMNVGSFADRGEIL